MNTKPKTFTMIIVLTLGKLAAMIGVGVLTYYLLNKYYYDMSTPITKGFAYSTPIMNDDFSSTKFLTVYFLTGIMPFIALFIIELTLSRFQSVR